LHDSVAGPFSAVESNKIKVLGDGTTAHRDYNVKVIQVRNILDVEVDRRATCCLVAGVLDRPKLMRFVKHDFHSCIVMTTAHVFGVGITHCVTVAGRAFEERLCEENLRFLVAVDAVQFQARAFFCLSPVYTGSQEAAEWVGIRVDSIHYACPGLCCGGTFADDIVRLTYDKNTNNVNHHMMMMDFFSPLWRIIM
jgi:hypothetical protein